MSTKTSILRMVIYDYLARRNPESQTVKYTYRPPMNAYAPDRPSPITGTLADTWHLVRHNSDMIWAVAIRR